LDEPVPARHLASVPDQPPAIAFAEVVRTVTAVARRGRLQVPVFRSPPRVPDADRTLLRRPNGQAVVAIRLAGRPFAAVQSDVIAGVVTINGLDGQDAGRFRRAAWAALDGSPTVDDERSVASDRSGRSGRGSLPSPAAPNVGVA